MGTIVDRTKDEFPNVLGAEYLEYKDESIPVGVKIIKSNIFSDESNTIIACKNLSFWGWVDDNGYSYSFNSPEAALSDYLKNIYIK